MTPTTMRALMPKRDVRAHRRHPRRTSYIKWLPRRHGLLRLFGHWRRLLFLLALRLDGPLCERDICRSINTASDRACTLAAHLHRCGLITKSRRTASKVYLDLDPTYPASRELIALLDRLAPHFVKYLRRTPAQDICSVRGQLQSYAAPDCKHLFGSKGQTATLLAVAACEEVGQIELAELVGIRYGSLSNVIAHWEREAIVRSRWEGWKRYLSLNPDFIAAAQLRMFLRRLSSGDPVQEAIRAFHGSRVRRQIGEIEDASSRPERLVPFGTKTQARLFLTLAIHGPATVCALAKALQTTQDSVRGVAHSLEECGLVRRLAVSRQLRPGRATDRWLCFQSQHPAAAQLFEYARAIDRVYPCPQPTNPAQVPARLREDQPGLQVARHLVGYDLRLRILCRLFHEPVCEVWSMAQALKTRVKVIYRHLRVLAARGLIRFVQERGQPRAWPNPTFAAARELRLLLFRLALISPSIYGSQDSL